MSLRSDSRTAQQPRPVARHGILRSPNPFVQLLTILGAIVAVVAISTATVGGFYVWDASRAVADSGVDIGGDAKPLPPSIGEIEGGVNLLLVGTDSCEGQDLALFPRCGNADAEGERNDVTMLVHISDEPRRVTVVSFPRDMIVPIPSCTGEDGTQYGSMSAQMINTSYMYGGLGCTVSTVEELTGIDIQFAAAIRWTGVINMSDAIGGVEVCLADPIKDVHTGIDWPAGYRTLEGAEALQFLRIRHGIGDGSDLGRISNQQQFMGSLVRKLQSGGVLGNPATLLNLANTALRQVNNKQLVLSESLTDPQLMVQIAMAARSVPYEDFVFVQYPTTYAAGGMRVLPVTSAADVLFDALSRNLPIKLSDNVSDGGSTEVVGNVDADGNVITPAPTDPAAPADPNAPADPADPATPEDPSATPNPTETAVVLPDSIPGQSADQVTCTRAQR